MARNDSPLKPACHILLKIFVALSSPLMESLDGLDLDKRWYSKSKLAYFFGVSQLESALTATASTSSTADRFCVSPGNQSTYVTT